MYYLYRHIRLDNSKPFYIGIGSKSKYYKNPNSFESEYRRAHMTTDRNTYWHNIVNKVGYKIEVLFETNNAKFIKEKEIEFISLYGRINLGNGILVNLTNGGDGGFGYVPTDETRLKLSIASKKKIHKPITEETRKKMVESHIGKRNFPIGLSPLKGTKKTVEFKAKMSKTMKAKNIVVSLETRAKISLANKGRTLSPEIIEAMRLRETGRKHTTEHKEKVRVANTGKKRTEEQKERISIAAIKREGIKKQQRNSGTHEAKELLS